MLSNWTLAQTTTTGTGTLTLAAYTDAASIIYPLPSALFPTNALVAYSIVASSGLKESGIGTIGATNTLARTKVLSTNDGTSTNYNNLTAAAVTLPSGTHLVYIDLISEAAMTGLMSPASFAAITSPGVISAHLGGAQANGSGVAAASRETAFPFVLLTGGLCTGMAVNVAAGGASSSTLLGLYEALTNGYPGRQLGVISAGLATTAPGYFSGSFSANVRLNPGVYWVAMNVTTGSLPTFTGYSNQQAHPFGVSVASLIQNVRADPASTTLSNPFNTTSIVAVTGNGAAIIPAIMLLMS